MLFSQKKPPKFGLSAFRSGRQEKLPCVIPEETVLIRGMEIEGDIEFCGKMEGSLTGADVATVKGFISGDVRCRTLQLVGGHIVGSVEADELMIDEKSTLDGPVRCKTAWINGALNGDITAGSVRLTAHGSCFGSITAASLEVERGASLDADIRLLQDDALEPLLAPHDQIL